MTKRWRNRRREWMFVDANVFVYMLLSLEDKGEKSRRIVRAIERGSIPAQTSPLVLDEVCWVIARHADRETAITSWEKLTRIPNIRILAINERVSMWVPGVMRTYGLKPRDAIHVATMRENAIDNILSDDSDFDKVKEITRVTLDDVALSIDEAKD
jgi:uncharacterized protein